MNLVLVQDRSLVPDCHLVLHLFADVGEAEVTV